MDDGVIQGHRKPPCSEKEVRLRTISETYPQPRNHGRSHMTVSQEWSDPRMSAAQLTIHRRLKLEASVACGMFCCWRFSTLSMGGGASGSV